MHYRRWTRGDRGERLSRPRFRVRTAEERFWAKVDKAGPVPEARPELGPCWVWTAGKRWNGYANLGVTNSSSTVAHKFAYELLVGPVPDGLQLDHLCRVRHCVNPSHLEPVPQVVNILRGEAFTAKNAVKTHCPKGHAYVDGNIKWKKCRSGNMGRECLTCHRERERNRSRSRRKATSDATAES